MNRLHTYAPHVYYFFFFAAAASYSPFLGFWFREAGLTNQQIGFLYAVGPLVALFVQPVWGLLCDKHGIEKAVLLLCSLLTPAIAFGYSTGGGFALYAATAVALAIFNSPMVPLADAIAIAHAEKHRQTYGAARVWGSIGFALIVSPIGMLYTHIGIQYMFTFYMAFMVVVFAITFVLKKGRVRKSASLRDVGKLLQNKPFAYFLLLVLLVACGNQSFSVFFSVYLGTTGGNVSEKIGWLTAVSALSELPFFVFATRLSERFGYRNMLALGAFAAALRLVIISFDPPMAVLLPSQMLQGITYALFYAAGVQCANDLCPEGWKTTAQTLFSMVYISMAVLIASNFGGWLIDQTGFPLMFRLAALLCLLGGIGFVATRRLGQKAGEAGSR
ncbi:MFS transporter [Paenibacillus ginsengarvi]|uniref:MFS transporter n=1 Tax=Paenibacillus ginsengarvi TaxID=400777 RepID=A0A3B0BU61_9BACL|nr:MFS transporter [Paenibacillus ginsengarvi]RKN75991.1 MFS transporter [Paenibacillus ginsengarvi]